MRKLLLSTVASAALALALGPTATPAVADVDVVVTVRKTQTISVTETITKDKDVLLEISALDLMADGAAEALALANVTNNYNAVGQSAQPGGDINDYAIFREALLKDSVILNSGVVELNMDTGNMNNQGNQLSAALVIDSAEDTIVFVEAMAEAEQINGGLEEGEGNSVVHLEIPEPTGENPGDPGFSILPGNANIYAAITDSINGNVGVVGVNVAGGNMNNSNNLVALAIGFGAEFALAEAALGQANSGGSVLEAGVKKTGEIVGSINDNSGVVGVNLAGGNMANQANIFSLAFVQGGPGNIAPAP
jgi:hypothetical protein